MDTIRVTCPSCGSLVPARATVCPKCGYALPVTMSATVVSTTTDPLITERESRTTIVEQPVEVVDNSWVPWAVTAFLLLLLGGGWALWNMGYLSDKPTTTIVRESVAPVPPTVIEQPDINVQVPAPRTPDVNIITPPPPPAPPAPSAPAVEVVSVSGQALETSTIDWTYGYTVKLRNNTSSPKTVSVRVKFLDAQKFTVDDDVLSSLTINAHSEATFDGDDLIPATAASRITTVKAELR